MKCKNYLCLFSAAFIIIAAVVQSGCRKGDDTVMADVTDAVPEIAEKETEPEPALSDGVPEIIETEPGTEPDPITELPTETAITETQPAETDKPSEINDQKPERLTSDFINMLTGLPATKDIYYKRPIAVMINNRKISCPQIGVSQADVMYECLVEGGITRLMMLVTDYDDCTEIGSVRSSREYFLDFAANHDAIYVHAGGSDTAYSDIKSRKINNLDGVNMYLPDTFYRDKWRIENMGLEHSLMTTGAKISSAVAYKGYRTEINDTFDSPFNFYNYKDGKKALDGGEAKHIIIKYNNAHFPQFIYNAKTDTYKRYQFNGIAHIDGANDEQLAFTNVLILNLPHSYTGDAYGHINVNTVGSGSGYYIYGGKYIPIFWIKKSKDAAMILTDTKGSELKINCGKTFVSIVSDQVWNSLILNYKK